MALTNWAIGNTDMFAAISDRCVSNMVSMEATATSRSNRIATGKATAGIAGGAGRAARYA